MSQQISYFSPGPAKIPNEALEIVQRELIHYDVTHVSVLELSHRSEDFLNIIRNAEALIKELLNVPDNYKILFFQGGGTGQFAAIPLNLISRTGKADYIVTGSWSAKAAKECEKYGEVNLVLPPTKRYTQVPTKDQWTLSPDASYVYYCDNETVEGIEFDFVPTVPEGVPLVCDMSSNICSRAVDISKFGVIYAGAQKNIGSAGVTVAIVREDLLGNALTLCPSVLDYTVLSKFESNYNTPPTFAIYVLGRTLEWVKRQGGVAEMEARAKVKHSMLYSLIDGSDKFYVNGVVRCRSRMNVTFRVGGENGNEILEKKFLEEAQKEGLLKLKGHRSVGGMRASLYNAITIDDVKRLVAFMEAFMLRNK